MKFVAIKGGRLKSMETSHSEPACRKAGLFQNLIILVNKLL